MLRFPRAEDRVRENLGVGIVPVSARRPAPKLARMTGPTLVMFIRHGEKPPSGGGTPMGVAPDGSEDKHSLTVRGWVRAGSLIGFFSSAHDGVETPTKIFAACSSDDAGPHGRRPAQTVTPLAEAHNPPMDTTFAVGNGRSRARSLRNRASCWFRGSITTFRLLSQVSGLRTLRANGLTRVLISYGSFAKPIMAIRSQRLDKTC